MCLKMEQSPLLSKDTMCTMWPHMSATLETNCEAHPDVFAYQMGSGVARLPSVAVIVSLKSKLPNISFPSLLFSLSGLGHILIHDCFMPSLSLQQGTIVLILVSQLAAQEEGTLLELMKKWHTAAGTTWFWWDPKNESVWRMASGQALSQNATVRHTQLLIISGHLIYPVSRQDTDVGFWLCTFCPSENGPPLMKYNYLLCCLYHLRKTCLCGSSTFRSTYIWYSNGGFTGIWQCNQKQPNHFRVSW